MVALKGNPEPIFAKGAHVSQMLTTLTRNNINHVFLETITTVHRLIIDLKLALGIIYFLSSPGIY